MVSDTLVLEVQGTLTIRERAYRRLQSPLGMLAIEFLDVIGHTVPVVHPEIGMNLMARIEKDLDEYGVVEAEPEFEGRQVVMVLAPKKRKR